jgi:mannose-6-phosphate isomerase
VAIVNLPRVAVPKPWGRYDLPPAFGKPEGRIGEIWFDDPSAGLPLLIKWLFTSEKLSVQVHPNDAQATAAGMARGKEECWIVIDAEPDAVLGIGTQKPLSAAELQSAANSGELESLIDWKPVRPGDWFHIAPGTVHAIGAGVTLVEIQQHADVTFRLYDYGRPRDLHLLEGAAVSKAEPYTDNRHGKLDPNADLQLLSSCPSFSVYYGTGHSFESLIETAYWLIPIKGSIGVGTTTYAAGSVIYGRMDNETMVSPDFSYLAAFAK